MTQSDSSRRILANLLAVRTGQQLGESRRWRIDTALAGILRERGFRSIDELTARLVSGGEPALADQVVEGLLNNETYFFRDRLPFDLLLGEPLQRLERARAREKRIRIWSAGCSSGQEAYSLAIAFAEQAARWRGWRIDIVGTDVSRGAIARARAGIYTQFEVQRGLPVTQMLRWFREKGAGEWALDPEVRDSVRFEVRNLIDPPPGGERFDIVLCRNVLLYFAPETRRAAFSRLAEAIARDGMLMLGAGETVIGHTELFVPDAASRGLYLPAAAVPRAKVA